MRCEVVRILNAVICIYFFNKVLEHQFLYFKYTLQEGGYCALFNFSQGLNTPPRYGTKSSGYAQSSTIMDSIVGTASKCSILLFPPPLPHLHSMLQTTNPHDMSLARPTNARTSPLYIQHWIGVGRVEMYFSQSVFMFGHFITARSTN